MVMVNLVGKLAACSMMRITMVRGFPIKHLFMDRWDNLGVTPITSPLRKTSPCRGMGILTSKIQGVPNNPRGWLSHSHTPDPWFWTMNNEHGSARLCLTVWLYDDNDTWLIGVQLSWVHHVHMLKACTAHKSMTHYHQFMGVYAYANKHILYHYVITYIVVHGISRIYQG